jgi:hypothetical protein
MTGVKPPGEWPWKELRAQVAAHGPGRLACLPRHVPEAAEIAREHGLSVFATRPGLVELRLQEGRPGTWIGPRAGPKPRRQP